MGSFAADYTADQRAWVYSNAEVELYIPDGSHIAGVCDHIQGHMGQGLGVPRVRLGRACRGHVAITNSPDFFHAVFFDQRVEVGVDLVQ